MEKNGRIVGVAYSKLLSDYPEELDDGKFSISSLRKLSSLADILQC